MNISKRRAGTLLIVIALTAVLAPTACAKRVIPGGMSIGVAVETEGLVVVGSSDIGRSPSPAYRAGLRQGDIITHVNGRRVYGVSQLEEMLDGSRAEVTYVRRGEEKHADINSVQDGEGVYRLGVWVRENAAGIGTLTFCDEDSGRYGALGHGVTDADSGIVLPIQGGSVYENSIVGIEKGVKGRPGEILGQFFAGARLGSIDKNDATGIYGKTDGSIVNALYPEGIETAARDEVRAGTAEILSTIDGGEVRSYACEVVSLDRSGEDDGRSFTIRVTDPELIERTGGIVQGMSGSPVVQNDRLIGAVTHVLVDDPTTGYGIFIDDMLEAA